MVHDPYFERWRAIQKGHLDTIDDAFADVPRLRLRLFDDEMVGVDRLRLLAGELYSGKDPISDFTAVSPFRVVESGEDVTMELDVPFFEKSELTVFRHGHELYVRLGSHRRSFVLPDALQRRDITKATLDGGTLRVSFGVRP
jgi:arsenite-transporting ATPase